MSLTTKEYVIRCTPASTEFPSYRVRDDSGEVQYFASIEQAIGEAIDLQDCTKSDVTYTVEAA